MNKENIVEEDNFKYFNSNKKWTLLGYLIFWHEHNVLRDKKLEHRRYEEYLDHIANNVPAKKDQALKAKKSLSNFGKSR